MPASQARPTEVIAAQTISDDPFGARTPWSAGAAAMFAIIAVVLAVGFAGLMQPLHAPLGAWIGRLFGGGAGDVGVIANTMLTLIVLQAAMIGLTWWGAGRFAGERLRVLSLDGGLPPHAFLWGLAGMAAVLIPYNLIVFWLFPSQFAADLRPMWDLARSPVNWLVAVAVVIGAPLSEELLFRGFLLPALVKTRRGFWGAAVASTFGWTALHFYSLAGLVEVFLIGVYFAWLTRRFGTLWLPLSLHALYNGLQLLVLANWPAL